MTRTIPDSQEQANLYFDNDRVPRSTRPDMAGYGVAQDSEGLLDWAWAERRLLAERNFWFVTANAEGRPHSMPVWGVWMPERERFGMCCDVGARKVRNIEANDQVVVTTTDTVECVSLEGRAVRVGGDEAEPLAVAWAEKYCDTDMSEAGCSKEEMMEAVYGGAAFEVVPERAFGMIETPEEFSKCATRWLWD